MTIFNKKDDSIQYYKTLKEKSNLILIQEDINNLMKKKFYVMNYDTLYNNIKKNEISYYYEYWTDGTKLKFAVDIDYRGDMDKNKLLREIINVIIEGAYKLYKIKYNIADIVILENQINQEKYSAHIIFDGLYFKNYLVAKDFYIYLNAEYDINKKYGIDGSIYNNTSLRTLGSSKMGKKSVLIPKIMTINHEQNTFPKNMYDYLKKSLITYCDNMNIEVIKTIHNNIIKKQIKSETNIDIKNIDLEYILDNLPSKYYDDYEYWLKIGMILYNYENSLYNMWDNFSKKSIKYKDDETVEKWGLFKNVENKLSLGSLIKWALDENLEKDKIFKNYKKINNIEGIVENYPVKEIEISDYNKIIINKKKLEESDIRTVIDSKLVYIQSEKSTGKTTNVLNTLLKYDNFENLKILVLSSRITFGYKMLGDLKNYGFRIYQEFKDYYINYPKIICQLDSLARLDVLEYDVVIIDESETLAKYKTSNHFIKNSKSDLILMTFECIIRTSNQIIVMDADLSDRCINYYNNICKTDDYKILINMYKYCNQYTINYLKKETWFLSLLDNINENKKIVIASASNNLAKNLYLYLINKFENKRILIIHKETDIEEKKQLLLNVNKTWTNYDIIIYTPTITMGVSFDIPDYFENIYVYGCSNSLEAQSLCQMIHRVRNPRDNNIYLTVDDYREYEINDEINYKSIEEIICSDYYLTKYDLHNCLIRKKLNYEDNVKIIDYPYKNEPIYDLYVRNCLERIENNINFSACLFGYIKFKEYNLKYINSINYEQEMLLWKEFENLNKSRQEDEKEEQVKKIMDAEDIDKNEYSNILKKRTEFITEDEINKLNKYNLKNTYLDNSNIDLLNEQLFIKEYFNIEKMCKYKNYSTIISIEDQSSDEKLELLKKTEINNIDNYDNCYMNLLKRNKYSYHFYAYTLIKLLEFDINDLSLIKDIDDKFRENLMKAIIFCNQNKLIIENKYRLKISKNILDLNENRKIKYISNIINAQYGLLINIINKTKCHLTDKNYYKEFNGRILNKKIIRIKNDDDNILSIDL